MLRDTADTFGWTPQLFLSQVISFVIVAYLLRRFAYKPILAVLEERRRRIEEGLVNADKIKQELAEAEKRYAEILAKANDRSPEDDRRGAGKQCPLSRAQTTRSDCHGRANYYQGTRARRSNMSAPWAS